VPRRRDAAAAAEYYPAAYWYAMMRFPERASSRAPAMPATGSDFDALAASVAGQHQDQRCWGCHALGTKATRTIPEEFSQLEGSHAAWARRIQAGQAITA